MDFRTVVIISTLLLMTADADKTLGPNIRETSLPAQTVSNIIKCSCPSATPAATASPTPSIRGSVSFFGVLQVRWKSKCEGDLIFYNLSISLPVCNISNKFIDGNLLMNLYENKKDCKMLPQFDKDRVRRNCFHISESGAEQRTGCETLIVKCKDVPDVKQLQAYKAVTALLCCVLLLLLVIRFTRPTVKALQKRLSDRRQNRWIGPTQSHSVSYHRGKTAVKNNDGEKRLSYPALERLAVSDSREPSSNRNSDYNF